MTNSSIAKWAEDAARAQSRWEKLQDEGRIYFAKGTWQELDIKEVNKANRLADMINAESNIYVAIIGHASGDGEAKDKNPVKLSLNRAMKVHTLFLAKNVDPYKLLGVDGVGSASPLANEGGTAAALAEARRKNRCVEVIFREVPRPNVDVLAEARKLARPRPPHQGVPGCPEPPPIWKDWWKFTPQVRQSEYEKFKEKIEEWAEKTHIDTDFYLNQLKDILFPSDTEGPFDVDLHKSPEKE